LVINKMRSTAITAEIRLQGLRGGNLIYWRFYSAAQDAVRNKGIATRTIRSDGDRIRQQFPPMSINLLEW
ncbi:MAG: hypothetical protein RMK45_10190, partial [Armatimonadota bacterium]|nr:hypothetical protein [Armatimonadota bacterium]